MMKMNEESKELYKALKKGGKRGRKDGCNKDIIMEFLLSGEKISLIEHETKDETVTRYQGINRLLIRYKAYDKIDVIMRKNYVIIVNCMC